jgi:hypothetical protein
MVGLAEWKTFSESSIACAALMAGRVCRDAKRWEIFIGFGLLPFITNDSNLGGCPYRVGPESVALAYGRTIRAEARPCVDLVIL